MKRLLAAFLALSVLVPCFALQPISLGGTTKCGEKTVLGDSDSEPGSGGGKPAFYGIEVDYSRHNFLFLLDISGSMSGTKLLTLKKELVRMLRDASDDSEKEHETGDLSFRRGKYFIGVYSCGTARFPKGRGVLLFSEPGDRERASRYVNGLYTDSMTSMLGAWRNFTEDIRKNRIDVVFFLSDGEPTDCSPRQLVDYLEKTFGEQGLRINCISIGEDSPLMREIADKFHGKYIVR